MEHIGLEDYLLYAEAVLDIPAQQLKYAMRVGLADSALNAPFATYGGHDAYPDFADKAAVLCSRLIRNHPLPDGNKRTAMLTMLDFIDRNGMVWITPTQEELAQTIEWVADRTLSEAAFIAWVRAHVHSPDVA